MLLTLPTPVSATTQESRKNNITPHILKRHLIKTPWTQPNFNVVAGIGGIAAESLVIEIALPVPCNFNSILNMTN